MTDTYHPVAKLPIEGHTVWPNVMRLLVIGTAVSGILLSFVFMLMLPPEQLRIDPQRLLLGLSCFVIFEVVVVRLLIIPINGDYGRFRINRENVEFYPLSTLGMKVLPRAQIVPVRDFKGITVQKTLFRDGVSRFHVILSHPQNSISIRVKLFTAEPEAKSFADSLSHELGVPVIS